jgi:ABC-type nickel/cobalt efflux system permease component RcnA
MPDPQPAPGADWPAQATDMIVKVVGQVRDKTTGPALTAARGVVYGLLAALLGGTIAVLFAIAAVRGLDEAIEAVVDSRETWAAHAIVGLVFTLVGLLLWSKRRPPDRD